MRSVLRHTLVVVAALATLPACESSRPLSDARTASDMAPARGVSMTPEQAQKLLDDVNAELFAANAGNPLRQPKTLDDVLAILESDQLDLFPAGAKLAMGDKSRKGKVLAAQLEIAWGENLRIVAHMVDLLSADLRRERRDLEQSEAVGKLSPEDAKRLTSITALIDHQDSILAAASRLAPVHLAKGAKLAEALVNETPEGYEGYRVLADYARIRGDWTKYDAMVKEVEQRHPQSNGLLFLKGIALTEREEDMEGGAKLLRDAVAKDPKFCRAQAHLVFLASGLTKKREELAKLKAMNPQHQLVALTGPIVEVVYEARERRRPRIQRLENRATTAP